MAKTQQEYQEAIKQVFRDADEDKSGILDKEHVAMEDNALQSDDSGFRRLMDIRFLWHTGAQIQWWY